MLYGWFGNYLSWEEALKDTKSYSDLIIYNKTINSINKVITKEATYTRDTIVFDRIEYEFHQSVLTGILKFALNSKKNHLNILDFGGSLGNTYFALKDFLKPLEINWNIVEQKEYIEYGKKNIKDIDFFYNIKDCLDEKNIDIIIFSSVLQYLENPYEVLTTILSYNLPCIILERTAILPNKNRLTIQKVPPSIYNSSYPSWFLNEEKIFSIFDSHNYTLIADFKELWSCNIENSQFKGYIYVK